MMKTLKVGCDYLSLDPQDNLKKIKYFDRNSNITALILGNLLKQNNEGKYWEALGYDSFADFIAQGEFSFTRRTAYNYIDLFDLFVKWKIDYDELISIPYSKVLKIKDVIDKDNLNEWLAKAKTLSRSDLDVEVREVLANEEDKEYKVMPKIYKCKEHGKWIIEVDINDCCPDWVKSFYDEAKKMFNL